MGYKLSTEVSEAQAVWSRQKFLMIGSAGIGKSDFWQHAEGVGYVQSEAGLEFITAIKNEVRSWADVHSLMGALMEAMKNDTFPYKTLVVDTIDRIVDLANEEALKWGREKFSKNEIRVLGDIPNGSGWFVRQGLVQKFLRGLEILPCCKVLVGHVETKKIEEDGAKPYDRKSISIGGKIGGDILAWSDHTLHVVGRRMGDTLKRTVHTKPTQSREAKSRGGAVKDGWVWEEESKSNFNKLRSVFT